MSEFESKYKELLLDCFKNGSYNENRTGIKTYSTFAKGISHNLRDGFPIITGKKILQKNFIHELIWILNGNTNIKYLNDNNVSIWDNWADSNGDIGLSYGYQLRKFNGEFDQLKFIIEQIKKDKYSRRHVVNLWNPLQVDKMNLPPCYFAFQFYVNNKDEISANVSMRSCDLFVGFPYDFALFAAMLIVIGKETQLKPSIINFNITDAHVYENQIDTIIKYINKPTFKLPKLTYIGNLKSIKSDDFSLLEYKSGIFIKTKIAI